jgi:RimJ/RimL family protein N-acetyltransferase
MVGQVWWVNGDSREVVLQTKRLTLSPSSPNDRADFMDLERDPEVMRYLNGGYAVDQADGDPDSLFLMPRGTEPYVWTARRKANDAFVGWFYFGPEGEGAAELGYRLRRADWGQGLASEATSALINWGFENCGYEKIFASTMTVNHASRRVLEKIGMRYERTIQLDWTVPFPGSEQGEVIYEVTRKSWRCS